MIRFCSFSFVVMPHWLLHIQSLKVFYSMKPKEKEVCSNQTWSTKWITNNFCQFNSNYIHCFINENSPTSNHKVTTTKIHYTFRFQNLTIQSNQQHKYTLELNLTPNTQNKINYNPNTLGFTNQVCTHIKLYIWQATISETWINISHTSITVHRFIEQ